MKRMSLRIAGSFLVVLLGTGFAARGETKTIARCGEGFLEEVDGYARPPRQGRPLPDGLPAGGPAPGRYPRARPFPVRGQGEGDAGRARRRQAAGPEADHQGDRGHPAQAHPRSVLRGDARGRRRRGDGRPGHHRRQLHPRAVPLLRVRAERVRDQGRHPLPRPDPRLRMRLAAPGARDPDRRRAPGQDPVRECHLCRVHRLGHRHECQEGLDRRDGRPGHGPLGRRPDGLAGPHGAGGGGYPRPRHRRLPRPPADL